MDNNFNYNNFENYNNDLNGGAGNNKIYAVACLICGIFSLVCCCFGWISAIVGVVSIVLFILDRYFNKKSNGLAIAGLVCAIVTLVLFALSFILVLLTADALYEFMDSPEFQSMMNEAGIDISDIGRF